MSTNSPTDRRSLLLTAPRQLAWQTDPLPPLGETDLLVQTRVGAISIGTEVPQYAATARSSTMLTYPHMTGYESYGEVVAVGSGVTRFQVGDRVVAFYGHRTHAVVPETRGVPVPAHINPQQALLAILTCDVAKGIRKLALRPEETVLVTGGGAIGLLTVGVLRLYGVQNVDVVEPIATRREIALLLGAAATYRPDEPLTTPYAVGFECSSYAAAFAQLQQALKPQGRLCVLSDGNRELLTLLPEFHSKELQIVGSSDGWDYHAHARWFFAALQDQPLPFERVFDLEVTATDLPDMFRQLAVGRQPVLKVLVNYGA